MVKGEERGGALVAIYYIQSWKDLSRLHWLSSGSNFMRLRDLPTETAKFRLNLSDRFVPHIEWKCMCQARACRGKTTSIQAAHPVHAPEVGTRHRSRHRALIWSICPR